MKFKLIIDEALEEEVVVTARRRNPLTDQIEMLVMQYAGEDSVCGYREDTWKQLRFADMECITVLEGKTYAIDRENTRYRLKQRLYELENILPAQFIRINKSTLANEKCLDHFAVTYSGGVDAVFKCGYREYVSRRCFAEIKRRLASK